MVNSQEYAGTMLKAGEFILQAIGSKYEMLAMTECECIYYRFIQPELFCDFRFNQIRLAFPLDGKRHGIVLAVFQKTDRIVEA